MKLLSLKLYILSFLKQPFSGMLVFLSSECCWLVERYSFCFLVCGFYTMLSLSQQKLIFHHNLDLFGHCNWSYWSSVCRAHNQGFLLNSLKVSADHLIMIPWVTLHFASFFNTPVWSCVLDFFLIASNGLNTLLLL